MAGHGLNNRERRELSERELEQLETMSGLGLSIDKIAIILDMSETALLEMRKKNPAVQRAIDLGRAKVTAQTTKSAYQMAMGGRVKRLGKDGKIQEWDEPPDSRMLIFWLKTREGFTETERRELTGPNGTPLGQPQPLQYTPEERRKLLDEHLRYLEQIKDPDEQP